MALKLDNALLEEIGLGALPADEKSKMLAHIYETLEMRVGVRLAEQMSDQQLDEFEAFINVNDEAGALRWLETTFPAYKQVVAEEFEKLKAEIAQVAPQIVSEALGAAQQQPIQPNQDYGQNQQPPYPPQAPTPPQY
jgi:predicted RNA-binding Zn ribbon-like protein